MNAQWRIYLCSFSHQSFQVTITIERTLKRMPLDEKPHTCLLLGLAWQPIYASHAQTGSSRSNESSVRLPDESFTAIFNQFKVSPFANIFPANWFRVQYFTLWHTVLCTCMYRSCSLPYLHRIVTEIYLSKCLDLISKIIQRKMMILIRLILNCLL